MNGFFRFMASAAGRIIRIVAGIGLIAWGLTGGAGENGTIIAVVGAVPLLTGTLDICLFAPLLGKPLKGSVVRAQNA